MFVCCFWHFQRFSLNFPLPEFLHLLHPIPSLLILEEPATNEASERTEYRSLASVLYTGFRKNFIPRGGTSEAPLTFPRSSELQ